MASKNLLHATLGTPLSGPWPVGTQQIFLGMGCFWGAERLMWQLPGVIGTAVGYQGGSSPQPSYEQVCSGRTGHTEAVAVYYDPDRISTRDILRVFWQEHDPTSWMRQGNDVGSQYRSAVYWTAPGQLAEIDQTRAEFQIALDAAGLGGICTEVEPVSVGGELFRPFYLAEEYHQQYLHKHPNGYACHSATGVKLP